MLNISKSNSFNVWKEKQDFLISSLISQPLIIVLRISQDNLDKLYFEDIICLINSLISSDIKNIEIAWSSHNNWVPFIKELRKQFPDISFGAASLTDPRSLEAIAELDFKFSMSPFWDLKLQLRARELGQLVIPGVFSPSEIQQAINFGYRAIKLFPASLLGKSYINKIKASFQPIPFFIAAGGMKIRDINSWLSNGCGAIILGRELIKDYQIDPDLEKWLKEK